MGLATKARLKKNQPEARRSNIPTEWLIGLSPDEAETFTKSWRASTYVLDKLKAILEKKINQIALDFEDDYSNSNWQYVRADKNGRIRVLEEVHKLLP